MTTPQCFAAGTLVHALDENGQPALVAIDKLKVGDMVLSRDEHNINAPLEYKPVTQTIVTENVRVYSLTVEPRWYSEMSRRELKARGLMNKDMSESFVVTADHPFWVENKGWVEAKKIAAIDLVVDINGVANYVIGGGR